MENTVNLYDRDFFAWTQAQANFIKHKEFDKLDLINLQEEVESMGKRERRELANRLEVLLMHLLKWKYQYEEQSKSWIRTIREQRHQILMVIEDNPSLKLELSNYLVKSYSYARINAHNETGIFLKSFPEQCEWTLEQILNEEFYPN